MSDIPGTDFISTIPPDETVSVIVPLHGLTQEQAVGGLNVQTLTATLSRLSSAKNKIYLFFVGEGENLASGVIEAISGYLTAHNAVAVNVPTGSTLGYYINVGVKEAIAQTKSKFFVVVTPYQMLGEHSIDILLEGLNKGNIGVLSGFDLAKKCSAIGYNEPITAEQFDAFQFNPARSFNGININFFGLSRPMAELLSIDETYKTNELLQQDAFYGLRGRVTMAIHQGIPTYSFTLDWSGVETPEVIGADSAYFLKKWGFSPTL